MRPASQHSPGVVPERAARPGYLRRTTTRRQNPPPRGKKSPGQKAPRTTDEGGRVRGRWHLLDQKRLGRKYAETQYAEAMLSGAYVESPETVRAMMMQVAGQPPVEMKAKAVSAWGKDLGKVILLEPACTAAGLNAKQLVACREDPTLLAAFSPRRRQCGAATDVPTRWMPSPQCASAAGGERAPPPNHQAALSACSLRCIL